MADRLARTVLMAPPAVARAAARGVADPERRWMLRQPRTVRAGYVRQVLDPGGGGSHDHVRRQIWMLRQPKGVRQSFIREVLDRLSDPPLEERWMLGQADRVRESYVRQVLEPRAR